MSRVLHFEQGGSLAKHLQEAGIEHGDTAEIVLEGAGVRHSTDGTPSIAFCPTTVHLVRILRRGTPEERQEKMPSDVCFSNNLRKRILAHAPAHGFVHLHLLVHSNGVLQLNGRVIGSEPAPKTLYVHAPTGYRDYQNA